MVSGWVCGYWGVSRRRSGRRCRTPSARRRSPCRTWSRTRRGRARVGARVTRLRAARGGSGSGAVSLDLPWALEGESE